MSSKEELMRMLGIKPAAPTVSRNEVVCEEGTALCDAEGREVQDTYLQVDEWDYAQGNRLAPHSLDMSSAMTDFFAAAFHQEPTPWENGQCLDGRREEFLKTMMETPDYQVLHESTRANVLASDMAATDFYSQYRLLLHNDQQKRDSQGNLTPGQASGNLHRAVGQALQKAQAEVDEMEEIDSALGCGKSGSGDGRMDLERVQRNFKRVRSSTNLRRIIELAGRYRRAAQAKQRQKACHGYDDMVGVELDGDVGRLLPLERVMLADEDFELDAMRRLVERQSMCREYRGMEKVAKGPIVICVDESGSMAGERIANAKAFALAMAWIARHQHRACVLVSFSDAYAVKSLALKPKKWDDAGLLDWLEHFFGGGTDTYGPLEKIPLAWEQSGMVKGKTDMILITDGLVDVPAERERLFKQFKTEEKCKLITIVIGERSAGELARVSDQVHLVQSIAVNSEAVDACFSI